MNEPAWLWNRAATCCLRPLRAGKSIQPVDQARGISARDIIEFLRLFLRRQVMRVADHEEGDSFRGRGDGPSQQPVRGGEDEAASGGGRELEEMAACERLHQEESLFYLRSGSRFARGFITPRLQPLPILRWKCGVRPLRYSLSDT
jgi:hypothetical protein